MYAESGMVIATPDTEVIAASINNDTIPAYLCVFFFPAILLISFILRLDLSYMVFEN